MGWNTHRIVDISLTPEASALDAGDVAVAITEIPNFFRDKGQAAKLLSMMLIDGADQGAALAFYFFQETVTFGTLDAAPSLSDADALKFLGRVVIATGDYDDLGGVRVAHRTGLDFLLKGAATSNSLWVAATCVATPTFGANPIVLRLGVEHL